jgi:predicted KAP-like P-loop ATPase
MEIKHEDLITNIDTSNPFAKCKLDREPIANILTNVISSYPTGFVLAINNEWGTGKTTFVKMWQQLLENSQFKTIYFNAWENDFDQNPLVAIISELKELSDPSSKRFFEAIIPKAATIAKSVVPAVVKAALKQCGIGDIVGAVAEGVTDVFEKEVDEYKTKKQTITEFRKELEAFVAKTKGDKPLVFFIDELDRCRPDYAVELLEQIKHLFSVKGIVFILSIDKEQLGHAIRGFYGSDRINAEEYLRRFIDLEYSLRPPSAQMFCNYLYDYYGFADVFRKFRGNWNTKREEFVCIYLLYLRHMS